MINKKRTDWLKRIRRGFQLDFNPKLDIDIFFDSILENSAYCYAIGVDITPILVFLDKQIDSFVCCDLCVLRNFNDQIIEFKKRLLAQDFFEYFSLTNDTYIFAARYSGYDIGNYNFSVWKDKNGKMLSILYIVADSDIAFRRIYEKNGIYPFALYNYRYEGNFVDLSNLPLEKLPKYLIGYHYRDDIYVKSKELCENFSEYSKGDFPILYVK